MAALAKLPESSLGSTPMTYEGECVTLASVYYDHIQRAVRFNSASTTQILGYAIARELGHMLLRTSDHSGTGIMMAKWRPTELQHAAQGLLTFTSQQAGSMQDEVAGRKKEAACLSH
jgi:hypothetical protein